MFKILKGDSRAALPQSASYERHTLGAGQLCSTAAACDSVCAGTCLVSLRADLHASIKAYNVNDPKATQGPQATRGVLDRAPSVEVRHFVGQAKQASKQASERASSQGMDEAEAALNLGKCTRRGASLLWV